MKPCLSNGYDVALVIFDLDDKSYCFLWFFSRMFYDITFVKLFAPLQYEFTDHYFAKV